VRLLGLSSASRNPHVRCANGMRAGLDPVPSLGCGEGNGRFQTSNCHPLDLTYASSPPGHRVTDSF
jgi:hypothetical protein